MFKGGIPMQKVLVQFKDAIKYLISDAPNYLKDDLVQDLNLFLCDLYKKLDGKLIKPLQLENYIFICLKNEKNRLLKFYRKYKTISLNEIMYGHVERIDIVQDKKSPDVHENQEIFILAKNMLTSKEFEYVELYYKYNLNQILIAKKNHTTQQSVSKILKRSVAKLKRYYGIK